MESDGAVDAVDAGLEREVEVGAGVAGVSERLLCDCKW